MKHADLLMTVLLATFAAAVLICIWRARRGHVPFVRRIAGVAAIEEAVGRATEMGRPIVFAMGFTNVQDIRTHVSLSVLSHVARLAARMQTELIVTLRVANVYPVAEETVREAYLTEGAIDRFNAEEQIRFLSEEGILHAMGTAKLIEEKQAGCGLFFGAFDFTSLLMAEPGARTGVLQIAGDPSLFQVPFFVCSCDNVVIGEEYFAAGAYLSPDPTMRSTLLSQDIIKAVIAALILAGTILVQFQWGAGTWLVRQLMNYK